MPFTLVQTYNAGSGQVQLDASDDAGLTVLSPGPGRFLTSLAVDGDATVINPATNYGNLAYGNIETLSDGGYVVYGVDHAGLGFGVRVQVFNADGSARTEILNPAFEDGADQALRYGFTLTATDDGGFAMAWNDVSHAGETTGVDYTPTDGWPHYSHSDPSIGYDVRFRYFDANGIATTASVVADDDVESFLGATGSRRASDQMIADSVTLANGATAFVYTDDRWLSGPGGGGHVEQQMSLQIARPGDVGEPIKVDVGIWNERFGVDSPDTIDNTNGANVVALADGNLAVVWSESTYVYDTSTWGNFRHSGWAGYVRYFDAEGNALSDRVQITSWGSEQGNITKYIWAEALSDGRIAFAYNSGIYGVNGNGTSDAYLGIIGQYGSSVEITRVNAVAAGNTQGYGIYDLAVRSDDTIDVAYNDAALQGNGGNLNQTRIDRISIGMGIDGVTRTGGAGDDALTGTNRTDLLIGNSGDDTLNGANGADRLFGGLGSDTLVGGTADDQLFGEAGDDVLLGGAGADDLRGGTGFDTVSYADGTSAVDIGFATGRALGYALRDRFTSIERVIGTAFGDTLVADDGGMTLTGAAGDDRLTGGLGADVLAGGAGNDVLKGGAGIDTADYGDATGPVTLTLGTTAAQATGGAGTDSLSGIENVIGSAFADVLTGNLLANRLDGAAGNDRLVGGQGDDVVIGGLGNDALDGGIGNDRLEGGDGNDRLYGRTGADTMVGGLGDDIYYVDQGYYSDVAVEAANGGLDTVYATIDHSLHDNVENLILQSGARSGYGNALDNTLTGNESENYLYGRNGADVLRGYDAGDYLGGEGGDDRLFGDAGDDTLNGGGGNDTLFGGSGIDALQGEGGSDLFVFEAGDTGATEATRDRIWDFTRGEDHISLTRIDANTTQSGDQAFAFIGSAAFNGTAGELRVEQVAYGGQQWSVQADTDGDGAADLLLYVWASDTSTATASDFYL